MREKKDHKCSINYVAMYEWLRKVMLDAQVIRAFFGESDYFAVLTMVRVREKKRYSISKNGDLKVLGREKMNKKECNEE